jgi:UDP-N-acetylglucosamine 2-epimerase (non-hydrolysing)
VADKLKLMTILGTRPEIIRLSEVIKKADKYFDHILGPYRAEYDYTLNQIFFEDLGLRQPDYTWKQWEKTWGENIGNIIG